MGFGISGVLGRQRAFVRLDRAIAASANVSTPRRSKRIFTRPAPTAAAITFAATLAAPDPRRHRRGMFSISDADVAAIVDASERGGELSAKIEVRRLFPGIPENAEALWAAMNIAGWEALLVSPPEP